MSRVQPLPLGGTPERRGDYGAGAPSRLQAEWRGRVDPLGSATGTLMENPKKYKKAS